jgi:hypothetical protein
MEQTKLDYETVEEELDALERLDYIDITKFVGSVPTKLNVNGRRFLKQLTTKRSQSAASSTIQTPGRLIQEEIDQQQILLIAHRRTLAVYLQRLALVGAAHVPPEVANGINDAREQIARVKTILRTAGVQVTDHPDD